MHRWLRFLLFILLPVSMAAQNLGTVTLIEGSLRLIRGSELMRGVEGMRLREGDILETANPGFAQLEFDRGSIVALGNDSRVLAYRQTSAKTADKAPAVELVLLSGWLKGETEPNGPAFRYDSPLLAATTKGTVVLHATPKSAEIYLESGPATVAELTPQGNLGRTITAKTGQFFTRRAGQSSLATAQRPDQAFVDAMPQPFRDTFPPRIARFKEKKNPEPKPDHQVTYPEVQSWLSIGQNWRRGFVERFRGRANDPEFRKALEAHLREHPEWDSVLHPEKFQKDAPQAQTSDSPQGGNAR